MKLIEIKNIFKIIKRIKVAINLILVLVFN
jgi:hypothetical protein